MESERSSSRTIDTGVVIVEVVEVIVTVVPGAASITSLMFIKKTSVWW